MQALLATELHRHYSTADIQRQHTESASTLTTSRGAGRAVGRRHNQLEPGIPGGACPVREYCPLERRRKRSQEALGEWARDIAVLEEPL